eukprot:392984_1
MQYAESLVFNNQPDKVLLVKNGVEAHPVQVVNSLCPHCSQPFESKMLCMSHFREFCANEMVERLNSTGVGSGVHVANRLIGELAISIRGGLIARAALLKFKKKKKKN